MPSTFSDLKIELIATGEQSGTWGSTTNNNLGIALEEAIVGRANADFASDADLTLTLTNTNATQIARHYILNVTSAVSLSTTRNLIVPTIDKPYIVENNTTGAQSIVVKTSAGTGVTVPNGKTMMVYANSTNVVSAFNNLASGTTIAGGTIARTDAGQTFTGAQVVQAAATQDAIQLSGRAGGTSAYSVTLTPSTLSASRTATLPDGGGNYTLGYLNIPQSGSAKTTAYPLVVGDVGKTVEVGSGGSIEIPDATFSAGDAVLLFNNTTAGITITCTITTAYIAGTDVDKATLTLATRGIASILFISGTVCVVTGNVS
jgi:hypothetical protein